MSQSNSLVYKAEKNIGSKDILVNIRLNDECKNGHQDFSITGDIYEASKRSDRAHISGVCIHKDILKHFPEFKIFVDLHLCDYTGVPMHATANGFYHLKNGFNNTTANSQNFKREFCKEYRLTPEQFDIISKSESEIQFYLHLKDLGILEQWKKEAEQGIKILEELTGLSFVIDSKRTQLIIPSDAAIQEELQKIESGYYTAEAKAQRYQDKIDNKIILMTYDIEVEHHKALFELELKKKVLLIGGFEALDDCIYYDHSKTLAFNWRTYSKGISQELYNKIEANIKLPEGVVMLFKK